MVATTAPAFGRRGVAPPTARPAAQARAATAPAAASRPTPAPAAPKAIDDSLLGYFLWLLFSFDRRLDRRTYRYARIVANLGYVFASYNLEAAMLKSGASPGMEMVLALSILGLTGLMIWTTLAMQVKRRHDRDKSWPWLFVGFIPIVGPIWVLVETCWLDGTPGYNRFDDPSRVAAAIF
jgi:uncharacterized membrane protein YhaH (DUF805 family)